MARGIGNHGLTGGGRAVSGDGGVQGSSESSTGVELSLQALQVVGKCQHVSLAGPRAPSACNLNPFQRA